MCKAISGYNDSIRIEKTMGRITDTFARLKTEGRTGLIGYLTVGFPTVQATLEIAPAIIDAGVDILEIGVPFSDPLADGPTIQRASQVALEQGVTLQTCIQVCDTLRQGNPLVPLLFFGYYNPILALGLDRFAKDAASAGADGVIVPDLPPEEAGPLLQACRSKEIDMIFLLAPTSTEKRIEEVSRVASGFIYCVSLTGVTGARNTLADGLPDFLARVRRHTNLPLAVGFGVSTREHVQTIGRHAEAAVVGSALINAVDAGGTTRGKEKARTFVTKLVGVQTDSATEAQP